MLRFIVVLALLFAVVVAWLYGATTALGFVAGAAIAYISFRSLDRAVQSLVSRVVHRAVRKARSHW